MSALATYRDLLAKVDAKFAEIRAAHPRSLQCRQGCHSCCKPGLTVSPVERENLRAHLATRPDVLEQALALEAADPHRGCRCSLLDADGACVVYDARPLVCRSHGVPLRVEDEAGGSRLDACPLNFVGEDLEALPKAHAINLETLNTLLALLNRQLTGGDELARTRLRASDLVDSKA